MKKLLTLLSILVFIVCFLMAISEYEGSILGMITFYAVASVGLYFSAMNINKIFRRYKIDKKLDHLVEKAKD